MQSDFLSQLESTADLRRAPFAHGHVAWRGFGEGPPLALLHGGHGSWMHWANNIPALARTHRVWVPDMPGYGDSSDPAAFTMDSLVEATVQSIDSIIGAGTPLRIAGFSFGGFSAARLAQVRGNVTHLAMLGPGGSKTTRRPRGELRAWRDLPLGSDEFHAVMRHNLQMHMLWEESSLDDTALQIHERSCLKTRFPSKRISLAGGLPSALEGSTARVLLISGENDVTVTPKAVEQLVLQARPDARCVVIPGAGHWVQYEAAGEVDRLLGEWLAKD
jgi:pimeloyl-ACP methyl ester carboxylesterase